MENNMGGVKICNCPHHKVAPFMVVLFGLLFLLAAFDVFTTKFVQIVWPILVIIAGGTKMFGHNCKCYVNH